MSTFTNKFTSMNQEWGTPSEIFNPLHQEFAFEIDLAASSANTKCLKFFDIAQDSMKQDWTGTCWLNPPFGRQMKDWVRKAYLSSRWHGSTVVCLLPAKTNTNWWHEYCVKGEIRFIRGRPKFIGCTHGLPFPLAIVIFRPTVAMNQRYEELLKLELEDTATAIHMTLKSWDEKHEYPREMTIPLRATLHTLLEGLRAAEDDIDG